MRTEQLLYFIEIAKRKSISLTSERLHISQQTLSSMIKNLEEELGVALFQRHYNGISLTLEGKAFLMTAHDMLDALDDFKLEYLHLTSNLKGTISLYASPILYSTILGDLIKKFCKIHPLIKIDVKEQDISSIIDHLLLETTHQSIGIIGLAPIAKDTIGLERYPSLCFRPLLSDHFLACFSHRSPLVNYKQIGVKTMLKYPLVVYSSPSEKNYMLYEQLASYGVAKIVLTTSNPFLYIESIANDVGVGFVPSLMLQHPLFKNVLEHLILLPVNDDLTLSIGYLINTCQAPSPEVQALIDFLAIYHY